jgi:hypothetical protein
LTTWRIDDVCLIWKEPTYTCRQTACTPQLPPRRSAALIAKTHTHKHLKHKQHITPALHKLSLFIFRSTILPQSSTNVSRPASSSESNSTHDTDSQLSEHRQPHSARRLRDNHIATRHVSIRPPCGTRAVRRQRTEELEEGLSPWCQVPKSTT